MGPCTPQRPHRTAPAPHQRQRQRRTGPAFVSSACATRPLTALIRECHTTHTPRSNLQPPTSIPPFPFPLPCGCRRQCASWRCASCRARTSVPCCGSAGRRCARTCGWRRCVCPSSQLPSGASAPPSMCSSGRACGGRRRSATRVRPPRWSRWGRRTSASGCRRAAAPTPHSGVPPPLQWVDLLPSPPLQASSDAASAAQLARLQRSAKAAADELADEREAMARELVAEKRAAETQKVRRC